MTVRSAHFVEIAAATVRLGSDAQTSADAVEQGLLDEQEARRIGVNRVPVAAGYEHAPGLAATAAVAAMESAKVPAGSVDLLLHAWTYYQGHDFWSPAHYVAHRSGASNAMPVGINQMCNGGAAALTLGVGLVEAGRNRTVLVTTGDVFGEAGFDRWFGDFGIGYGDAGTALVLRAADATPSYPSYSSTAMSLLDIESRVMSDAEVMHRGDDPFGRRPLQHSERVDVRRTKRAFMRSHDMDGFLERSRRAVAEIVGTLAHRQGWGDSRQAVTGVVMPRVGKKILDSTYAAGTDDALPGAECLSYGFESGHLGAGDMAANLAALSRSGPFDAGDRFILLSAGGGFTITGIAVAL